LPVCMACALQLDVVLSAPRTDMRLSTLSVVTCTHCDPEGLESTLHSLEPLHRSNRAWEHLVVDASPGVSAKVLKSLPSGWPLRHLVQAPQGVYPALNAGAHLATGNYLWFLNGGDRLKSITVLESALGALERDDCLGLVCCGADLVRDGEYLHTTVPKRTLLRSILGRNGICHQAVVYRTRTFREVGDFDPGLALVADYDHHFRCHLTGARARCTPDVLVEFDTTGLSSNYRLVEHEIRSVHRRYWRRVPVGVAVMNEVLRVEDSVRVRSIKLLASSRLGPMLRPLGLAWRRIALLRHR